MSQFQDQIDLLHTAELQFRLASAVRLASSLDTQPLDLPMDWSHGNHSVTYGEIALRQEQGDFAAWCLQRTATYMMAMAMKDAIRVVIPDPKNSSDANVRASYQISRFIRNAFAHSPFHPIWFIDTDCQGQVFAVQDIIRFDTTGLNGTPFDWRHYGGPLALFKLSRFVRANILGEVPKTRTVIPIPKKVYYQQGTLVIEQLSEGKDAT